MGLLDKLNIQSFFGLSDDEYDDYEEDTYTLPRSQLTSPKETTQTPIRTMQSVAQDTTNTQTSAYKTRTNYSQPRSYSTSRQPSPVVNNTYAKVERPQKTTSTSSRREEKVVSMNQPPSQSRGRASQTNKIAIKEPRVYSEAMEIGKLVISNEAVLINFHMMEENAARRVIDFLTGIVYAIDGDIQRVGNEIFIATPANLEIDGDTARSLLHQHNFDF